MTNCDEGGCERCANPDRYKSGTAYDICICVHAEQNALLAAARFGIAVEGAIPLLHHEAVFRLHKRAVAGTGQRGGVPRRLATPRPGTALRVRKAAGPLPRRRKATIRRSALRPLFLTGAQVPVCPALAITRLPRPRSGNHRGKGIGWCLRVPRTASMAPTRGATTWSQRFGVGGWCRGTDGADINSRLTSI